MHHRDPAGSVTLGRLAKKGLHEFPRQLLLHESFGRSDRIGECLGKTRAQPERRPWRVVEARVPRFSLHAGK